MDSVTVWMLLVGAWLVFGLMVSHWLEESTAVFFFFCLLCLLVVGFMVKLSIMFLQYHQAWPFIAQ